MTIADAGLVKVRDGKVIQVFAERDGLPRPLGGKGEFSVTLACQDRKGNLWLAGTGPWLGRLKGGVFTAYPNSNTLSSLPLPPASDSPAGLIPELFEDREGNLWIGTDGSGLIRAREQAVDVTSARHGLKGSNIYPVCEDSSGAVWIGAWNHGLARIKDGEIEEAASKIPVQGDRYPSMPEQMTSH